MLKKLIEYAASKKALIAAAVICGSLANTAQAIPFEQIHNIYFFGDSLTDSGFYTGVYPSVPAGKADTYTTFGGFTWAQYVANDISPSRYPLGPTLTNNCLSPFNPCQYQGVDYAAGGSTTNSTGFPPAPSPTALAPSLFQQINYFLSSHANTPIDPNDIFFIWSGANDLLTQLLTLPTDPTAAQLQLLTAANTAALNISNDIAQLSSKGAKRFVVLSLPNIGTTPFINGLGNPNLPSGFQAVSFSFNSFLNQYLGSLITRYGIKVLYFDTYTLLDNVIRSVQRGQPYKEGFDFVNYTMPACGAVPTAIYCPSGTPNGYVFADSLHPTDLAHRLLATELEAKILSWN